MFACEHKTLHVIKVRVVPTKYLFYKKEGVDAEYLENGNLNPSMYVRKKKNNNHNKNKVRGKNERTKNEKVGEGNVFRNLFFLMRLVY